MSLSLTRIGTNSIANITLQSVFKTSRVLRKNMVAVSSGKRINSAEDGAASFSLSRGLENRRRSLAQAIENIATAENVLEIALSGYASINTALMDIRESVVQGADGIYSSDQRAAIQGKIDALIAEVDAIANTTQFQGNSLLDGSFTGKKFQVGASAGDIFDVDLQAADIAALALTGVDVSTSAAATASFSILDDAINTLHIAMQRAGEIVTRLRIKQDNLAVQALNTEATRSRIEDTDYARQSQQMVKSQIIQEMGMNSFNAALVAPQQVLSLF